MQIILALVAIGFAIYGLMIFYYAVTRLWYIWLGMAFLYGIVEYPNLTGIAVISLIGFIALFFAWIEAEDSTSTRTYSGYSSGSYSGSRSYGGSSYDHSQEGSAVSEEDSSEEETEEGIVPYPQGSTSRRTNGDIKNFDEEGGLFSITREGSDFLGNEFKEHLDPVSYRRIARSEIETDFMGNEYIQHYDEEGHKAGTSKVTTDHFGQIIVKHYDEEGHHIGTSRERTDWTGLIEYTDHTSY